MPHETKSKKKYAIEDHISVTRDPEQVTPFQDWPHGLSPFALHCVSCGGEFKLPYSAFRAEAAH